MAVEVALADVVEAAVGNPIALVVGDEEFVTWAHPDATGRAESGSEWLEMPASVGPINPATPGGIVSHIPPSLPLRFTIGDHEFAARAEVEGCIFSAERIHNRAVVIFVVFAGDAEGVGDALVTVAGSVFIVIDEAREFGFLRDVIGIFFFVVVDAIGLHEVLGELGPGLVFVFPDLAFPRDNREGAIGFMTEAKNGDCSFGERDGFEFIASRDLREQRSGEEGEDQRFHLLGGNGEGIVALWGKRDCGGLTIDDGMNEGFVIFRFIGDELDVRGLEDRACAF